MSIYIHKNNQQYGPYEETIVVKWLQEGQCSPTDHARREGERDWRPLQNLLSGPYYQAEPQPPYPPPVPTNPFTAVAAPPRKMTLMGGFTYIFEDRDWFKKSLIGSVITAVPIVEAITNGYQMEVINNIKAGSPRPLPEWDNVGKMFGKGFILWLAVNLFYVPSIILSFLGGFLGIPWLIGGIVLTSSLLFDTTWEQGQLMRIVFGLLQIIISAVLSICTLALPLAFLIVPVMALRCAETGSFLSTINFFSHIKFVLRHLGDYVLARIAVVIMIALVGGVGSAVGGGTFWTVIGGLLGLVIVGAARFWGRLMWSYYLAHMRLKELQ